MRTFLLLSLIALVARADDNTANEGVVKDVRALLSATKQRDIDSAKKKLFARADLDWFLGKRCNSFQHGRRPAGEYFGPGEFVRW